MEFNQFTLSQAAAHDKQTGARQRLTGWGKVCAERSHKDSKSQKRKRNAKAQMMNKPKEVW